MRLGSSAGAWVLAGAIVLLGCPGDDEPTEIVADTPTPPPRADVGPALDAEPGADVIAPIDIPDVASPPDAAPEPDADDADVDAEDVPDVPPPPPPPDYLVCDAGDEAWVKQVVPALLARRPHGIREVRVLVDMVAATSRAEVARRLMEGPEFIERWRQWFMDELRVNRVGDKKHPECYGPPMQPEDNGEIAGFVRDQSPANSDLGLEYNMTDVLLSSLKLDDISPLYRGHLFAMMARPITGANVSALALDITRRQDFGEIFEATYLHRNSVCTGCHNSLFSTTDHPEPLKDRHWQVPGLFEKAVYGNSAGIPEMEVYSIFRHINVVKTKNNVRPWGLHESCGRFAKPGTFQDDPAGIEAFFIVPQGLQASVWITEGSLHTGFDMLREDGLQMDPTTLEVDGFEAFAYLLSMRVSNRVWREIFGYPLTLVHYFPRNEAQRNILMELTTHFVTEEWSLRTLLVDMVTHPLFAETAPIDGCGPEDNPYLLPPVFNPWIIEEEDEAMRANSVGDAAHRYNARVLLNMVATSLGWPEPTAFPAAPAEAFQKAVGVFVKDAEPGFDGVDFQGLLAWEDTFAACESQVDAPADNPESCLGICAEQATSGCWCDPECFQFDDCCPDFQAICIDGVIPEGGVDWIGQLEYTVEALQAQGLGQPPTVGDVVSALKDRLITQPDIAADGEAALIAALLEVDSLETPLADVEDWAARLRRYCGLLLQTPQFMLAGVADPDQVLAPSIIVGLATYQAECESLSATMFDPTEWIVTCGEASLTIEPADPDPEPVPDPGPDPDPAPDAEP